MKSKFAKFVDSTIGAILIFLAATAVMRYFTTLDLAVFCGMCIAISACLMLRITGAKREDKQKLSVAADNMFYEFMFKDERAPVRRLFGALKDKYPSVAMHGKAVYANGVAAVCAFDRTPDKKSLARIIACAKHYGAKRAVILCKTPPTERIDIDGFDIKYAVGNDVYVLFRSLDIVPEPEYSLKNTSRARAFASALGKDKIKGYLMLSVFLFAVSIMTGYSIIPLVCASVGAILFVAAIVYNIRNGKRTRKN